MVLSLVNTKHIALYIKPHLAAWLIEAQINFCFIPQSVLYPRTIDRQDGVIHRMGHEKVARVKANNMRSRTASGEGGGGGNADRTTVD
jgi:hypothetical protein